MTKNEFFENEIKDNNYEGISIPSIHDDINKEKKAKADIFKELKKIYSAFALKDIKEFTHNIVFGEEYDANDEQKLFELKGDNFDNAKIYTFNIVGSIKYKDQTFNINSRFGDEFLQYMIASSNGFLELENSGGFTKDVSLAEWIMIYYFKIRLKDAFNLGVYKTYATQNEDLLSIRGQIDINHYIKKGSLFDGKTRCNYKEHSYSNEINYIISLAINKISKNKKYQPIVKDILTIKNAFNQIEYKKQNIRFLVKTKVKNPFYSKYNEVFKLAYNILENNFGANGKEDFSALLFDISLLFEHHIRSLLKTKYQLDIKNKKEFKIPNGNNGSDIFPDVIIHHDDGSISIYDVKYKHFGYEVNRDDRFQLVSYVAIYMQNYQIRECGFIYPTNSNEENKEQSLKLCNVEIPFKIIFYKVSSIEDDKSEENNSKVSSEEKDKKDERNKKYQSFVKKQKKIDEDFLELFQF
jgi:5-methylcytosine-specific restriction endonuclease McrBC regulatory subunit McrC